MKIAIVGSRDYVDYDDFSDKVRFVLVHYFRAGIGEWEEDLCIISGGARGADALAEQWAKEQNISCKVIKPNYDIPNPKIAPFLRNTKIAEQCTEMLAFWNGKSKGTEDVIKKAVKLGKQVTIFGVTTEVA